MIHPSNILLFVSSYMHSSIYPSIHPSIYSPYICPGHRPSTNSSIHRFICLSIHPFSSSGAGMFVTTIVVGSVVLSRPFSLTQRPYMRDLIFYIAAVYWTFYILWNNRITIGISIGKWMGHLPSIICLPKFRDKNYICVSYNVYGRYPRTLTSLVLGHNYI